MSTRSPHFATEYEGRHAWVDWNAVIVQALNHQLTPAP
jgi:enterochelin esterase-like enzyme